MTGRVAPALILAGLMTMAPGVALPGGPGILPLEAARAAPAVPADAPWVAPTSTSRDTTVVTMTNRLTFEDDTVRIAAGETVVWRNTSVLVHTVTADPERAAKEGSVRLPDEAEPFHSGRLEPDATFSHTFRVPGTYAYFCVPHEGAGMTGTIVVSGP